MSLDTSTLTDGVGFETLGEELGADVRSSITEALSARAVFNGDPDPTMILRRALSSAIRDIEEHPRGDLLRRFLRDGPYRDDRETPAGPSDDHLSDEETERAVTFVYSHMVNSFKGELAELLALGPCTRIVTELQQSGRVPNTARLYVGDAVHVPRSGATQFAKGGDAYVLAPADRDDRLLVLGAVEVKSYDCSPIRLRKQLSNHIERASRRLRIQGLREVSTVCAADRDNILQISVAPSTWRLQRGFRLEPTANGRVLHYESAKPVDQADRVQCVRRNEWHVTLRWSVEALASVAYEMTFWYMEKIGEILYSNDLPVEWKAMSPGDAGRNAVKMMLYFAIPRCRDPRQLQRAVALYNVYGFGYALGMNFRDRQRRREMLWPEDLDEVSTKGITKHGCRFV